MAPSNTEYLARLKTRPGHEALTTHDRFIFFALPPNEKGTLGGERKFVYSDDALELVVHKLSSNIALVQEPAGYWCWIPSSKLETIS